MFNHRPFDASAYLILWQVGVAGDKSLQVFESTVQQKQLLVDLLLDTYSADHPVTLYECAVLPIESMRADTVKLIDLAQQPMNMKTTLVIPPGKDKQKNQAMIEKAAQCAKK